MYIQCRISSLRFQNDIVIATSTTRHLVLISMASFCGRDTDCFCISITSPTILHSQLHSTSSLGRSHIQINHIITLRKSIVATWHNKELRPSSCWNKMNSTIHNWWFASHSKEWERSICIGLLINFLFYLDSCGCRSHLDGTANLSPTTSRLFRKVSIFNKILI